MAVWFTLFFLIPILIIILYSLLRKGMYAGVAANGNPLILLKHLVEDIGSVIQGREAPNRDFTLEAYGALSNPNFALITIRTLFTSVVATVITILIALPCGYYMARSKYQTALLLLIIIPFWTNFLIRVFAWMNILGNNGFINEFLLRIKLIDEYIEFLYNQGAVGLVLVYMYLPYAILPLFSTIDKFDFSLLEAARDLGATKAQSMFKILLPNIRSGLYTAVLFTFIPIFGAYAVPALIGGMESYMLGNVIADQLTRARNWPVASAISMVLTVITTLGVILMMNLQRRDASRVLEVKGIGA
ncbi:MAG: ABC transporter permease [Spirochaetaceae bacterium]|nr:ABC transporter permease [Spirochaetaceae bacterium]